MTATRIHVHTQADKSTVLFAKFMWQTMQSLANHPDALTITVHCIGPSAAARADEWVKLGPGNAEIIHAKKGDRLNGSHGHGVCVMSALAMTGDGDIHVICDSDTVVVAKGWDDYLRQRLITHKFGIVGSTYEELGGFSSGKNMVQTYKKVPSLTFCALSPFHDWRNLDILPRKKHRVDINTPLLSEIYNLPQGYTVFGEVGWQLPQYLHDHKLTYEGWRQLKPSKDAVVLKGLTDYHEEYHAGGVPFMVHHRGSMRHPFRGDRISQAFYAAVEHYLAADHGDSRWGWDDKDDKEIPVFVSKDESSPEPERGPATVVEVQPEEYVATGKEWLKISYNGSVIRPRCKVDRKVRDRTLDITPPAVDRIGHMRIEGGLEHDYPVVLPECGMSPYVITLRNATGSTLLISEGKGPPLRMPTGFTWWVLVDIDAVQRVQ